MLKKSQNNFYVVLFQYKIIEKKLFLCKLK